jgi:hypothetical protein
MINRSRVAAFMLVTSGALSSFAYPALASGAGNGANNGANDIGALISTLGPSAVSGTELAKMRGGSGTVAAVNLGTDTDNSVTDSATGTISNTGSVNDNTGLTSVMQNTGNNALLQSSMTVNITVH